MSCISYFCISAVMDLPSVRWGEVVIRLCRRVVFAAAQIIAPNLVLVLERIGKLPSDLPPPAMDTLDECVAAAFEWASPEERCRVYGFLHKELRDTKHTRPAKPDLISNSDERKDEYFGQENLLYAHAQSWICLVEFAISRVTPEVFITQAYRELPPELRRRIRDLGCIVCSRDPPIPRQSPSPQHRRSRSTQQTKCAKPVTIGTITRTYDVSTFASYVEKPKEVVTNDVLLNSALQDAKKIIRNKVAPKVRTTKAQEERAKFNQSKTITPSQERLNAKSQSKAPIDNAKPRYHDPKNTAENIKKLANPKKVVNKFSSSESSRNSSPIHARNFRPTRILIKTRTVSQVCTQKFFILF